MYLIDLNDLMPEYKKLKEVLLASLKLDVHIFALSSQLTNNTGETVLCCEKKYLANRLEAFLVLYNWHEHKNEGWDISESNENNIHHVLDGPIMAGLRGYNFNFFDTGWALEGISRSFLDDPNGWESQKIVGEIVLNGVAYKVTDYGKSFKNMIGEPIIAANLKWSWGGNMYLYETDNYYVLHDFWTSD